MAEVLTGSNSYVTTEEAAAYFADRLHADAWTSASADDQAKALVTAAVLLDRHIVWQGAKASPDQGMEWPRLDIPGITSTTTPQAVKVAQMELALVLLAQDTTALPDTAGMRSIQADTIKIEVAPDDRVKVIPDQVFALVAPYGFRSGGLRTISLQRV